MNVMKDGKDKPNMRTMSLFLALLLSLACNAQAFFIRLHGIVTEYESGAPLKNVLIHISSNRGEMDLLTKKDGLYSVELKPGSDYQVSFIKKGMVTKMVSINASSVPKYPDVPFYDMDLQMTMFDHIEDVNFAFFESPIARAEYKHSTRALNWENEYTNTQNLKMAKFMREYRKKKVGYYAKSNNKPKIIIFDSILVLSDDTSDVAVVEEVLNNFEPPDSVVNYYDQSAAPATQVETIKGLFFTVQVGVYSKPTSLDRIYNITPLNSELMENGKIRYTSGVFKTMDEAEGYRKKVVVLGVKDAFIVAYFNGKRIPLEDAIYLQEKFGSRITRQ